MTSKVNLYIGSLLILLILITGCKVGNSDYKKILTEEDAIELADRYINMLLIWDESGIREITTGDVFTEKENVIIPKGFDHIRITNEIEFFDLGDKTLKIIFYDNDKFIKTDGIRELEFNFIREVLIDAESRKVKGFYYTYSFARDYDLEFNDEEIHLQSQ